MSARPARLRQAMATISRPAGIALSIVFILGLGALALVAVPWQSSSPAREFAVPATPYRITVTPAPAPTGRPTLRDARRDGANVPVLELYIDFQCPECSEFVRMGLPTIEADYVETGRLVIEWHDLPVSGAESLAAANAARCANEQGAFWPYATELLNNQLGENRGSFTRTTLVAFAATLRLNSASFTACLDAGRYNGQIARDRTDAEALGISGLPSFRLGAKILQGPETTSQLATWLRGSLDPASNGPISPALSPTPRS